MADDRAIEIRPQDIQHYNFDLYESVSAPQMVAAVQMDRAFQVTNMRGRLEGGLPGYYLVVDVDRPQNIMAMRGEQFERGYKSVEAPKKGKSKSQRRR